MKKIRGILSHLLISLLLVLVLLVILDGYNPAMGFLNSAVAKVFYIVLFATGLFAAITLAWQNS